MKKQFTFILTFLILPFFITAQCWKTVSGGIYHNLAIRSDGTLWAWGSNRKGELGDGSRIDKVQPVQIGTDKNWQSVAAGYQNSAAIKTDGTLWVWGDVIYPNENNDTAYVLKNVPTQLGTSNDWLSISILDHYLAIKKNGTLWAWGRNDYYQLGNGTSSKEYNKIKQVGIENDWAFASANYRYSTALKRMVHCGFGV
jgi:alpha-tubulin suppressor-like RCC1 family protein